MDRQHFDPPPWFFEPIAVIDLETTGLDHREHRIVQLAVVHVDAGEIGDSWQTLIDPGRPIPAEATAVHGITDADVANAPTLADVADELRQRIEGRTLAGYNVAAFDLPFLRAELERAGLPMQPHNPIDVLVWVREIDRFVRGKGRHKLTTTCARWGVRLDGAHEARADAIATWTLLRALILARPKTFALGLDALTSAQRSLAERQDADFRAYLARQGVSA